MKMEVSSEFNIWELKAATVGCNYDGSISYKSMHGLVVWFICSPKLFRILLVLFITDVKLLAGSAWNPSKACSARLSMMRNKTSHGQRSPHRSKKVKLSPDSQGKNQKNCPNAICDSHRVLALFQDRVNRLISAKGRLP